MSRTLWFTGGMVFSALCAGVVAKLWFSGAHGFSAREKPTAPEIWLARRARIMALPADAKSRENPVPDTPEVIAEAEAHWADHCAACHANNGSGDTDLGRGLYPPAPDMRLPQTRQLRDGELFYIIENGIRLSGMPAWGGPEHGAHDSWKLVRLIRHLPVLTPREIANMEKLNPKSPDDIERETRENEFLNSPAKDRR